MSESILFAGFVALLLGAAIPIIGRAGEWPRKASFLLTVAGGILLAAFSAKIIYANELFSFAAYQIIPLLRFSFLVDRLAAFFILVISVVSIAVAIYSMQYVEHGRHNRRKNLLASLMNIFILSMVLVVASSTTFSFLFFWEIMSLSSFLLVMYEYEKKEAGKAGMFYFIMTHLSTMFLLFAFIILYSASGSFDIAQVKSLSPLMMSLAFLSLFLGFGTKAGIVPFHKWLPYAHPASPSNISALMSGVMIKVAIYGLIRFVLFVLSPDLWWGALILAAGTISAILGIVYALKEHDIKRFLAYSSIENVGIILIGFGLSIIFNYYWLSSLATLSIIAALFHTLNHALFKSLLFLAAGSVVNATGTRNIEEMGGLIKKMPYTAALFLIGAVSISALPPFNGFVSELMIFQAFFQSTEIGSPLVKVLLLFSLSIFALMSALAAACFVKAFGITFLAAQRSKEAEHAKEVPKLMLLGPAILAGLCIFLGVFSYQIFSFLGYSFNTPNMLLLGSGLLASYAVAWLYLKAFASGKTRAAETWGCGIISQSPKMEYTASGFSEPIVTIFKPIYRTQKHAERNYFDAQKSIFKDGNAEIRLMKFFEEYMYMPVARFAEAVSCRVSEAFRGDVDLHIAYIFATIILILIAVGWPA